MYLEHICFAQQNTGGALMQATRWPPVTVGHRWATSGSLHYLLAIWWLNTILLCKAKGSIFLAFQSRIRHKCGQPLGKCLSSHRRQVYNSVFLLGKWLDFIILSKLFPGTGVTTYSLHPGAIKTELQRYSSTLDFFISIAPWPLMIDTYHGAQTQICCAVDPSLATTTGKYYS